MIIFLGEYQQNLCQAANKSCDPCPERLPSCIGKSDGLNPVPTKMWQADYIKCYKNRTMEVTKCPTGKYFNPRLNKCMKLVEPGKILLNLSLRSFYLRYLSQYKRYSTLSHESFTAVFTIHNYSQKYIQQSCLEQR